MQRDTVGAGAFYYGYCRGAYVFEDKVEDCASGAVDDTGDDVQERDKDYDFDAVEHLCGPEDYSEFPAQGRGDSVLCAGSLFDGADSVLVEEDGS